MTRAADIEATYTQMRDRLIRLAATIVGPEAAGDVVSEVFVALVRQPRLEMSNVGGYLYRMTVNQAISYERSRTRHRNRLARYLRLQPGHVAQPVDQGRDDEVELALRSLTAQQRAAIHMTYWEDLAPLAIAEALGVSEGTVRKQLARARERLREELGHHDRD